MTQEHLEILGSVLGCIGALLLATNSRWSGWGFVAFLASNVAWILFSEQAGHHWFLVQQAVFTFTSLLGVWRWLIQPRMDDLVARLFKGLGER